MAGCRVTGVQAVTGAWESAICAVRIPSEKKPRDAMTMWRADERRCEPRDGMNLYGRALHCTKGSGVLYQVEVGSWLPVCKLRRGSRQKTVGWIIVRVSYVFDTIHGQLTGKSFGLFDRSLNALCLFVHKACM